MARPVGKNVIFVEFYLYSQDGISGRKNWVDITKKMHECQTEVYLWFPARLIKLKNPPSIHKIGRTDAGSLHRFLQEEQGLFSLTQGLLLGLSKTDCRGFSLALTKVEFNLSCWVHLCLNLDKKSLKVQEGRCWM